MTRIKVCGVTTPEQALACVEAGAHAIGVNLIASSPRCVPEPRAGEIAKAVGASALVVAVVAGRSAVDLRVFREATGVGCLQLHGDETPADVEALLPHAYKAVRISEERDVALAAQMPGEYLLVDAKVPGALGGTGRAFDWRLVVALARQRRLVLAGGLTPANVEEAIRVVRPWCVDVASGVERSPGVKDLAKVSAFVAAVRRADGAALG